jgi:histidinol-phosphate aminotransferase
MFRKIIQKMSPYVPGEQPRRGRSFIKLNTNENPYPPSPRVVRAIASVVKNGRLHLYPPPRGDEFIASAARLYGMPQSMIVAGNGSDELLAMLFRATLGRGDRVAYPVPTYSLYDTLATIQEASVVRIPFPGNFELPVQALIGARAQMTIICSPNSPSGTIFPAALLARLARGLDGRLLVIDEAYVDFADTNALSLVRRCDNVAVLRSLSKSFSLAGMRLGLCFAHPAIVEALMKVKDSYNLSRIALAAGAAALRDVAWMRRNVDRVRRTRESVIAQLREIGFEVLPSAANFVFARLPGRDLQPLVFGLRRRAILVRHFPALSDSVRISIGTPREMRLLLTSLKLLVGERNSRASRGNVAPG